MKAIERTMWAGLVGLTLAAGGCRSSEVASQPREVAAPAPPSDAAGWRQLSEREASIIVGKGTERPFTGEYHDHKADGTYRCKRCGAALFASGAKFDSRSGWPSFDESLPGAVREIPDADGQRVEIVCARCGGHLGHVFRGEGFTSQDTRHCVNSASLEFSDGAAAE